MDSIGDRTEMEADELRFQEKENRQEDDESQQQQQSQSQLKSKMSRKSIGRRVSFAATAHVRFVLFTPRYSNSTRQTLTNLI